MQCLSYGLNEYLSKAKLAKVGMGKNGQPIILM